MKKILLGGLITILTLTLLSYTTTDGSLKHSNLFNKKSLICIYMSAEFSIFLLSLANENLN